MQSLTKRFKEARDFIGRRVFTLLLLSIVAALLTSGVEIAFSILIQSFFVSLGILPPTVAALPGWAPREFAPAVAFLILFTAMRTILQAFKALAQGLTLESFNAYIRSRILEWSLRRSSWDSARIVTLMNERVSSTGHVMMSLQNFTIQTFTCCVIFGYLLWTSPLMAILGVSLLGALGILLKLFDRYISAVGENVAQLSSSFNSRFLGALRNVQFLRVCRFEEREITLIRNYLDSYFRANRSYLTVLGIKYAAPQFFGVIVVIAISIAARQYHLLSGGVFLSFLYLFVRLSQAIAELATSSTIIRLYLPQTKELFWWTKDHSSLKSAPKGAIPPASRKPLPPVSWNMKGISLTYGPQAVLKNLNLAVPAGKITVLRGPSGVGKSTVLGILAGILPPTSGLVEMNDSQAPVNDQVQAGKVRFGFVGPEPVVVSGSLRENILFGSDTPPSPEEIEESLRLASCTDFIASHPRGLDRVVNDRGEGLSTGQKQRLSLARALLRNPNALLLDEPTANLDDASKALIKASLTTLRGKATVVIATHDDSLAEIADFVQVFQPAQQSQGSE